MRYKMRFLVLFGLATLCANCERAGFYNDLVQNDDMNAFEKRAAISNMLEKSIKESGGIAGVFSGEFVSKHCQVSSLKGGHTIPLPFKPSDAPFGPHVQVMALYILNNKSDGSIWLGHFQIPFEISEEQFALYLSDKSEKIDILNYHFPKEGLVD